MHISAATQTRVATISPEVVAAETMGPIRETQRSVRYRPDVDGLRAVAILSVITFHAYPRLLPGGFVGVDVFFVISGYLISQILLGELAQERFSFARFYARRARRIFPSLFVVLAAAVSIGWFALPPELYQALGAHTIAGSAFSANLLDYRESGYFDMAAESKPLLHLWSLGIEEQFYIFWPLLLWAAWSFFSSRLAAFFALAVSSFWLSVHLTQVNPQAAFYLPHARFWELLIGCILAYAFLPRIPGTFAGSSSGLLAFERIPGDPERMRNFASIIGFVTILGATMFINRHRAFPGWWALLPTLGTALMIAAGPQAWLNRNVLGNRFAVWIGLISFQLYLWHWPLLVFLRVMSSDTPTLTQRASVIAASFMLAWLTWKYIDKPIRFGQRPRLKTAGAFIGLIFTALTGIAVFSAHGVPSRYPQSVQQLAAFKYDYAKNYRQGTCFLMPEQEAAAFATCAEGPVGSNARRILLWGDSHAAHLYPGLKSVLGETVSLTQRTTSGCPPIVGLDISDRRFCRAINDWVFESLLHAPPREIVLAARWDFYDWKQLTRTIRRLKEAGVESIYVIGPVPRWNTNLSIALSQYLAAAIDKAYVPQWTKFGLLSAPLQLDHEMMEFFASQPVIYVSPIGILCNDNGCLTRTGNGLESLTAWDETHLTNTGSHYLISHSAIH